MNIINRPGNGLLDLKLYTWVKIALLVTSNLNVIKLFS